MTDIQKLTERIIAFRNARNWKQFHNAKDLSISLALEAAEVMEHFQWKNEGEMKEHIKKHKQDISGELADVLYWVLLLSHDLNIDIVKASAEKMKENEQKYPVAKAKGKHLKYNKL